jgi:pimeloyl-ACP methyl ester carboxylesterase
LEVWDELDDAHDADSWVRGTAERALRHSSGAGLVDLIAKSISTRAIALPEASGLPAILLTPLLGERAIVAALAPRSAPTLLVGGSADPSWRRERAAGSQIEALEIDGADHALQIEGDPTASLDALREVVGVADAFLARLELPRASTA